MVRCRQNRVAKNEAGKNEAAMTETLFTPLSALLGGALIGLAAVMLMAATGRIAGISGMAGHLLPPYADNGRAGRLVFLLGLAVAPLVWAILTGRLPHQTLTAEPLVLVAGGLLTGFGSAYGRGCTSGHGVCGLARLSRLSLLAVGLFMASAAVTVLVVRHLA